MTESTGCITTHPLWGHGFRYARTAGTLVANTLVKILDTQGKEVDVGEKGEVSPNQTIQHILKRMGGS